MIHLKLAWSSLKRYRQQYGLFVLATAILVALNFIFLSLLGNSSLIHNNYGRYLLIITRLCLYFSMLLSAIFMFYVNSFLMKQRDQELGLFNILGLTRSNLRSILLLENLLLYLGTVILGLLFGSSFLKLAFLALNKLMHNQTITEQWVGAAFIKTIIIIAAFFVLLSLYDLGRLRKVKPINLWQQASKGEKEPKNHNILAILGVLILGLGYYIAVTVRPTANSILQFTLAVFLVVIGTYLVFIAFSISVLKFLRHRQHFYYQPQHFISISGMLYRMKQNGAGLASICLLCTAILVTMFTTVSMYSGIQDILKTWNPYDVMIMSKSPLTKIEQQQIEAVGHQNNIKLGAQHQMQMTTPTFGKLTKTKFQKGNLNSATHQLSTLTLADYNRMQHQHIRLNDRQVLLYSPDVSYKTSSLIIGQQKYAVRQISRFNLFFNYQHGIFTPVFIVAANRQIAQQINPQRWLNVTGFDTQGPHQLQFAQQLQEKLHLDNANYTALTINSRFFNTLFGSFLFLGIIISLAMILTTALLLYYKQIAEGYADRGRFQTMQQVGLSRQESRRAIHSQVLTVFYLPVIGAIINLAFATPAIINVLKTFSVYNVKILIMVGAITLICLCTVYTLLYSLTTKVYEHLVHA
ncbi:FtsX-like permease family protein [Bombilactobacillus bombi]|uniref:FtsX-like permease family protein n=1 Tax=Bombilactobacillus bombi TaxID=1303590 RepID=UPI0015E5DC36|nr:FtsX-like permease family protein [Bombilactobacillus bombi]MBA1434394.1 ABC transporter permease [Bombilactobacillus bombi]